MCRNLEEMRRVLLRFMLKKKVVMGKSRDALDVGSENLKILELWGNAESLCK